MIWAGSMPRRLSREPQGQQSPGHLVLPALGFKDRNSVGARVVFPNSPGCHQQVCSRAPGPGWSLQEARVVRRESRNDRELGRPVKLASESSILTASQMENNSNSLIWTSKTPHHRHGTSVPGTSHRSPVLPLPSSLFSPCPPMDHHKHVAFQPCNGDCPVCLAEFLTASQPDWALLLHRVSVGREL